MPGAKSPHVATAFEICGLGGRGEAVGAGELGKPGRETSRSGIVVRRNWGGDGLG
jgi:hypothetical protein